LQELEVLFDDAGSDSFAFATWQCDLTRPTSRDIAVPVTDIERLRTRAFCGVLSRSYISNNAFSVITPDGRVASFANLPP
jgi:hypothetical protein